MIRFIRPPADRNSSLLTARADPFSTDLSGDSNEVTQQGITRTRCLTFVSLRFDGA